MKRKTVKDSAGRLVTSFECMPLMWMREFSQVAPKDNLSLLPPKQPSNILEKVIAPVDAKIKSVINRWKLNFLSKIGVYPPLTENVKFYIEYPNRRLIEVEFVNSKKYFGFVSLFGYPQWRPYNIYGHIGWSSQYSYKGDRCTHKVSDLFFIIFSVFYLETTPKDALKEARSILSSLKGEK